MKYIVLMIILILFLYIFTDTINREEMETIHKLQYEQFKTDSNAIDKDTDMNFIYYWLYFGIPFVILIIIVIYTITRKKKNE